MSSRTAMVLGARRARLRGARGDPIFGAIARGLGRLVKPAIKGIKAILGGSKTAAVLRSPGTGGLIPAGSSRAARIARTAVGAVAAGGLFEIGGELIDAVTGEPVGKKRRRMNVLNPRALSRSVRRLAGFHRRSASVTKQLRKLAPPSSRRRLPSHGHSVHSGTHVHSD